MSNFMAALYEARENFRGYKVWDGDTFSRICKDVAARFAVNPEQLMGRFMLDARIRRMIARA